MTTTLASSKVIVSAVIGKTQRDDLVHLAREGDRSISAEIRRAIAAHVAQRPNNPEDTP